MAIRPDQLPQNPVELARMVLALSLELDRLKAMLDSIKRLTFGSRSERRTVLTVGQMVLDLGDRPSAPAPAAEANDNSPTAGLKTQRAAAKPIAMWGRCRRTFLVSSRSSSRP